MSFNYPKKAQKSTGSVFRNHLQYHGSPIVIKYPYKNIFTASICTRAKLGRKWNLNKKLPLTTLLLQNNYKQ